MKYIQELHEAVKKSPWLFDTGKDFEFKIYDDSILKLKVIDKNEDEEWKKWEVSIKRYNSSDFEPLLIFTFDDMSHYKDVQIKNKEIFASFIHALFLAEREDETQLMPVK